MNSTYGNKRRPLVKNQRSLRYQTQSLKRKINKKYESLLDEEIQKAAKEKSKIDLQSVHDSVMKITNVIASNRPNVLSSEYKAIHYIQQKDKFNSESKVKEELTGVDKLYKDLGDSLFANIVSASEQTGEELQNKNIRQLDVINYSMNTTKANMTYKTIEEAYQKALESTVVAYDLETYGGLSSTTGVWTPRGITEFSFQTMDVAKYMKENGDFESYIKKETAVIGMTKEEADMWMNKIEKSLKGTGKLTDEELIVTAKRAQMYGNAIFSKRDGGITVVDRFPGDEVFKGGFDLKQMRKGFDELVKARDYALQHVDENGILPYHKKLFQQVAEIQNKGLTVLDFNGLNFDHPVLNGIMNSIMNNEYKNNIEALNYINGLFDNGYAVFDPQSRIDAMGIFKEASQITGTEKVLGPNARVITAAINKNRIHRQENFMEGFNPDLMFSENMDRHKAEDDTTNVLRAVFEKIDAFKKDGENTSAFENAMGIVRKDREEKQVPIKGIRKGKIEKSYEYQNKEKKLNEKIDKKMEQLLSDAEKNGIKLNITREDVIKTYGLEFDESKINQKVFVKKGQYLQKTVEASYETISLGKDADKVIFKSRGEISGEGRNILDFTYDKANGTYRTKTGRIIGGKDEASIASDGVVKAGFRTGGYSSKGAYYTIGSAFKMINDDETIQKLGIAPEYANKHLYVLRMDPYFIDEETRQAYKDYDNPIFRVFTSKDKLEAELSNDFEVAAKIGKDGIKLEDRSDFTINTIGIDGLERDNIDVIEDYSDKDLLNREIKNYYDKKIQETGASHISTKTSKRTLDYDNLRRAIMAELGTDKINMKEHLIEAKRISETVSREGVIKAEDQRIYDLVRTHLGFKDSRIGTQQLYSNTLNNYINTSEKYDSLSNIAGAIRGTLGKQKAAEVLEIKMDSAMDYIVDEFAQTHYGPDYLFEKAKEIKMTNAEMKSTYQIDVSKFQSDRRNIHKIKSNVTTMDEDGIFTINLNGLSVQSLSERIRDLAYGNNDKKKDLASTTSAMIDFVDHVYNTTDIRNKKMTQLRKKIKNGDYKNSSIIAEELILALKEEKKIDVSNGIIRNTAGNFNPLDDMEFLKELNKHIATDEGKALVKKAVSQAPDVVPYKAGSTAHLNNIVDDILMPKVTNSDGKLIKGSEALKYILSTNSATANSDVERKIFETHWNQIRKSHMKNIEALSSVVEKTGGSLLTVNGTIYAKYGDEAVAFNSLARTVYEYGTLAHVVDKTKVAAHMNIDAVVTKSGTTQADFVSNLEVISDSIRRNKRKLEEAAKNGKAPTDLVDLFRGKITKEMREESVISTYNIHERFAQNKVGIGLGFGKIMPQLVGVEKDAILKGHEFFDAEAMSIIRDEIVRLGDNYDGKLTPQMTEAFGKNAIPILESFENLSPVLRELLPYISASSKDTDVGGKPNMNLYLSADRYSQGPSTLRDAAKRPTLQAGKIDYNKEDLEAGMESYIKSNKEKFGMVGTIFEDKKKDRVIAGKGIKSIESAVTVKKANVGNLGLSVILENHVNKVLAENTVENNVEISVKRLDDLRKVKRLTSIAMEELSLQEQEKIVDTRLVDSIFEHSSNVQHVRSKDMGEYYSNMLDVTEMINRLTSSDVSEVEKKLAIQEAQIAERISKNTMQFSYDENGKIKVFTPEGELVRRGDKILSYYDKYNPDGKVASKIHLGRFQHGVFEEAGNIRLKDSEIAKFLNENLQVIKGESNEDLSRRSLELLQQHFKVNYTVSDIRQSTYSKFMDDAVEKDMTNAPYIGLGKLDEKIAASLKAYEHKTEGSLDILNGKVIKMSELNLLLKDYSGSGEGVYKTKEELMKAIDKERHALSDFIYREIEQFKDVSIIANHQSGKHKNYGMISDNVIGSVYESLLKQSDSKEDAMKTLIKALGEYDVFDKDTMEIKSDGTGIYIKPKSGKSSHSQYKFEGENLLEDVSRLRIGGKDEQGKEIGLRGLIKKLTPELYHEQINYYNHKTKSIEKIDALGEITFGSLTYIDSNNEKVTVENVALMSKGITVLQQAVDPETMTRYDYGVLKALTQKKNAQTSLLDLQVNFDKEKQELIDKYKLKNNITSDDKEGTIAAEDYAKEILNAKKKAAMNDLAEAQMELAGYEDHASPKKIGKQEFGVYSRNRWNYSTVEAMEKFVNADDISEEAMMARRKFLENNTKGVMSIVEENEKYKFNLKEGLEGQSAYRIYMEDLIASKIYDERIDIELKDEYLNMKDSELNFKKYGHLGDIKRDIIKVAEEIGEDKVSIRFAEDLYQAKSAVQATEFNHGTNRISVQQMEELGFKNITIDELITHGMQTEALNIKDGMEENLRLSTIFDGNNLLYLGEEFGARSNPEAYIALPKAGKVLENSEVSVKFQSQLRTLQENLIEYNKGNFLSDSDEAKDLKNRISKNIGDIKDSIRKYTYDKDGILHDLSTVHSQDAFRLKFSFANNTHNFKGIGDDALRAELVDREDHMLKVAKINGTSIADLEKNGIYTDYAFISEDTFKELGYFDKERLATLPGNYDLESEEGLKAAEKEMKRRLQEDGIIANTGRYPIIMDDSEKATRIFLGENVQNNRARVSVVTALSMNADNDGDSASYSILRTKGEGFNDYLQYKINMENKVTGADIERNAQMFGEIEALMAYKAAGVNNYYHKQSMDDLHSEIGKAIDNGTITEKFTSIKNRALFNEMLYANNGQSPNTEAMLKNKATLDRYAQAAQKLSPDLADMTPIDITPINASVKNQRVLAEYYDAHIKVLEEAQKTNPNVLKELGLGENAITDFRENAIARTMWFESLEETQSKSRKSSIGPINVVLQKIRAGADALYINNHTDRNSVINHNVAGQVAYELEQEVISAKHGSVVTQIDKGRELKTLTDNYIYNSSDENKQLLLDFFNGTGESKAKNLDDGTINKIWDKMESSGIVNKNDLNLLSGATDDDMINAKRRFVGERYTNVLASIGKSPDAKRAMALHTVGGSGANFNSFNAPMDIDSAGKFAAAVLNNESYENNKRKRAYQDIADSVADRVHFSDMSGNHRAPSAIADTIGSMKGKGLALGALTVAAGVLVSGFAGSPVDQSGASELAKQEEDNNSSAGAPVFLDQGNQVTRSSSKGYIINMKATSNRDSRHTQNAFRSAASEAVGGGVNINMTIRNREVSNENIEQWITGL